jgi:hypothetical protein
MTVAHIRPAEVETFSFGWGWMKWFVSPVTIRERRTPRAR